MPQLYCYVPEPLARKLHERAEAAGQSTSRYLAELIHRDVSGGWPDGYFERVVGAWHGALERPAQLAAEVRDPFSA